MKITRSEGFERILEIIPGFSIWILILLPFIGGLTIPEVMIYYFVALSTFWFYRAFLTTFGATIGLYRANRDMHIDWQEKIKNLNYSELPNNENLDEKDLFPKHLIIYPQRVPNINVLRETLSGIRNQNYPKDKIFIAISFEERAVKKMSDPTSVEDLKQEIINEFPEFSGKIMFYMHPDNIPGEAIGAGPNRTWGAKNAIIELRERGLDTSKFLITSPDEDIVFHKEFLGACSYEYLTADKRGQKFYQTALYTFNNNYWQVPILIRVLVSSLTIPVLSSSVTERHKRETFSCYTIELDLLEKVDYWDTRYGIDDTTFYWRPYFYFNGDWECEVFFIPLSADAIYNPNYIQNHRDQYKQYLRWGWGVIAFPIGMKGLIESKTIPLWRRLEKIYHLFEVFIFWKVLAYLITFGVPILLLLNPNFYQSQIWFTGPNTISTVMTFALIFLIPTTIYKAIISPAKPKGWSWFRFTFSLIIEAPLNLITIFLYSTIPFIEASTRMMIGQKESRKVSWSDKNR